MRFLDHPVWLVGFRPFFALALLSGALLPALWVLIFGGAIPGPSVSFPWVQWHAHEMFFGFGWAMLGGFLLTATKNWVQVRGYHGPTLALLAAAWLFERAGMWFQADWPLLLFRVSNNLFLALIVALLLRTLIVHRRTDSFRDNAFFLVFLPLFLVAKQLMLSPAHFAEGWGMATALFRMAFLVMLERTMTQFMKGAFRIDLPRRPALDSTIKLAGLALVAADFLPAPAAAALAAALAALLLARLATWSPRQALSRLDIGIMVLGYLGIVAQLLIEAAARLGPSSWVGAISVHAFGLGVMGLVIPAMVVRIAKGHTGRKVVFEPADKGVLYLMMLAVAFRLVFPQLDPARYVLWLDMAAACWLAGFFTLAWRYVPFLLAPRVDGREH